MRKRDSSTTDRLVTDAPISKISQVIVFFPGLNLFLGHLDSVDPPSFDDLEKIMNTLGIVCALVLGTVFSLGGACGYDELVAADDRYYENEHFRFFVDGFASYDMVGKPPSAIYIKYVSVSTHIILYTLFILILMYIYLVAGIDQGGGMERIQVSIW